MTAILSEVKEMEDKGEENQILDITDEAAATEEISSELKEPCWSVVTDKSIAVSHLTYEEAVQWAEDLKKQGISGLCIITDEAAARAGNEN
jgi:hypothetical protein